MKGTTKMFLTGMVVTILVMKPSVGVAFVTAISNGISTVAGAMQEPTVRHEPPVVVQANDDEFKVKILSLFDKLFERLDKKEEPKEEFITSGPLAPIDTPVVVTPSSKEVAYNQALAEQAILERHERYTGEDPIVRKRLNLPPKLKSIDQFEYKDEVSAATFDKEFAAKVGKK